MRHGQFNRWWWCLYRCFAALFGGSQHADAQLIGAIPVPPGAVSRGCADRWKRGEYRGCFVAAARKPGRAQAELIAGRSRKEAVLQRSTISIELDDAPVHSAFLQSCKAGADLSVELPSVPPGFHELRIRSRLVSGSGPVRRTDRQAAVAANFGRQCSGVFAAPQKRCTPVGR